MEVTAVLVFASSLFSMCSVCPGCARAMEAPSPDSTEGKSIIDASDSTPQFNDTAAEFIVPLANSTIEHLDNSSDLMANQLSSTDIHLINCNPERKPSECRDNLLEICRSIDGIFRCACPENISRAENGKCIVFNECSDRSFHNCSSYATCIDSPDGYTCRCKDGYRDASEVEGTLHGRVCVSLHWDVNGQKDGPDSVDAGIRPNSADGDSGTINSSFGNTSGSGSAPAIISQSGTSTAPASSVDTSASTVTATAYTESTDTHDQPPNAGSSTPPPTLTELLDGNLTAWNITGNLTEEAEANKVLADLPVNFDKDSNFTKTKPHRKITKSNSSLRNVSFAATSLPLLLTTPKASNQQKPSKNSEDHDLRKIDLPIPLEANTLKEIFTAFDSDGNDLVSFFELKKAVEQYGLRLTDKEIHEMINVADLTGEGLVDFGEFSSLMKKAA